MAGRNWRDEARHILAQQDWALLVLIIGCGVAIAVIEFQDPVQRPVFIYDATISYENKPNTIDDFLAPLIPAIVFIFSLVLVEFYLFRRDRVAATAAFLRFFMACWAALMTVGFFTELFKIICGRLRPDFLDRCQPKFDPNALEKAFSQQMSTKLWGVPPSVECTNTNLHDLRDGRVSFPSGHSSTAYVVGWFGCFYLCWGINCRAGQKMHRKLYKPTNGFWKRVWKECISSFLLALMLFQLAYPWGVGVSRFRDNRHNASDIIAGFMLGITFAPIFLLRAVGQHDWWVAYYPDYEAESGKHLPVAEDHAAVPNGNGEAAVPAVGSAAA